MARQQFNEHILSKITEKRIFTIRGQRVMLDSDLAELYQVKTKEINLSVKRNVERFPEEFMFQLTSIEQEELNLRLQIATSSLGRHGGRRYPPYVFTEHGVAMLSSVLSSSRAIQVNIIIIKTFIRIKQLTGSHHEIFKRLDELEKKSAGYDHKISDIFQTIRQLLEPAVNPRRPMGIRGPKNEE